MKEVRHTRFAMGRETYSMVLERSWPPAASSVLDPGAGTPVIACYFFTVSTPSISSRKYRP